MNEMRKKKQPVLKITLGFLRLQIQPTLSSSLRHSIFLVPKYLQDWCCLTSSALLKRATSLGHASGDSPEKGAKCLKEW